MIRNIVIKDNQVVTAKKKIILLGNTFQSLLETAL